MAKTKTSPTTYAKTVATQNAKFRVEAFNAALEADKAARKQLAAARKTSA